MYAIVERKYCREAEAEKQDEIDGNSSNVKIESADHVLKAELKFDDLSMESKIKKEVGEMRTSKTSISSTSPDIQTISNNKQYIENKQNYKQGFMYRSQANVEANVGSMDRLQRLKALLIRDYSLY